MTPTPLTPKYLYRPLYRPAAFANLPKGWDYVEAPPDLAYRGLRRDLPMSSWIFGIIGYDRMLTPEEIRDHELERYN